jgi:predicted nucleic acid-binding protein
VLQRLEKLNLVGGAIYDALIAQAALKAKAERLLTLNPSHFLRLGQDVEAVVLVPGKKT